MFKATYVTSLVAALSLAACGDVAGPQTDHNAAVGKSDSAGAFCGGIAGLPCGDGYACQLDGDYPDAGGHCVISQQQPDPCWGAWIDQSGTCRTPADGVYPAECCENKICGGIAGLPCPEGYECELDGDYPDASGECVKPEPKPAACHVGGCSSQLCTDRPGMISTCEWLPHYACYQLSQCGAVGRDGACGWKQTPDLVACLAQWGVD